MTSCGSLIRSAAAIFAGAIVFAPTSAGAQDAHVHGHAEIRIGIDAGKLLLELESPAMDLVGFESEPADDAQAAKVEAAVASLNQADLFVPTPTAGCRAVTADASFATEGDHAGFRVSRSWQCEAPDRLEGIATEWFARFSGSNELDVQAAGPGGQRAIELERGATQIDLTAVAG